VTIEQCLENLQNDPVLKYIFALYFRGK